MLAKKPSRPDNKEPKAEEAKPAEAHAFGVQDEFLRRVLKSLVLLMKGFCCVFE